jgi:hypothetical protein
MGRWKNGGNICKSCSTRAKLNKKNPRRRVVYRIRPITSPYYHHPLGFLKNWPQENAPTLFVSVNLRLTNNSDPQMNANTCSMNFPRIVMR